MYKIKALLLTFLISVSTFVHASTPIPVDNAFNFSASVKNKETITATWNIAPGYHLYRDRFCFKMLTPENAHITKFDLPNGIPKEDNILGKYQVFDKKLHINIPLNHIKSDKVSLLVCYQGCSDSNFCYPPVTKKVTLNLKDQGQTVKGIPTTAVTPETISTEAISSQDKITALLMNGSFFWILLSFFGFGIMLSFTPCVLPMIPILSGLIIGHGKQISTRKAFFLSLVYVLGMAITYAIAGVLAGFAGQSIQTALQTPWVIVLFSLFFVLLSLSLFGFYELKLPTKLQEKLTSASNHQKSGSYIGVAIMGVLATLIVSPCVTAPLIGALAYIGNTGNSVLGGSALFVMALGMGVPLLIIGTSHGNLLPKAGNWMNTVKAFFGVLMLIVAIWMLSRVIPTQVTLLLWAGLLLICSIYMGLMQPATTGWQKFWKGLAFISAVYGIILMIGVALGANNPLQPLAPLKASQQQIMPIQPTLFQPVKGINGFKQKLQQGKAEDKITVLDFYADWCVSCKEMEHKTFNNPQVSRALKAFNVIQANITQQDKIDKALMKAYGVIAPPAILFFDVNGNELKNARIVGEMGPKKFLKHIAAIENTTSALHTTNAPKKTMPTNALLESIKERQ